MALGKGSELDSLQTNHADGYGPRQLPSMFLGVAIMVGCGASSASTITGVARSPRGPDCDLTLISPSDVYPGAKYANEYEVVGLVWVTGKPGAQATDLEVKAEVRPRACAMGGELIALLKSIPLWGIDPSTTERNQASVEMGQKLKFAVYAKKMITAPQKY